MTRKIVIRGLAIAILGVICLWAGWNIRIRGNIKVIPQMDISGAETVYYRQDDSRWGGDKLGNSEYTMASSGCLVTCIAAAIEMADGEAAGELGGGGDPGALNAYLSANQVYDADGNLQWDPLDALPEFAVDVYNSISPQILQDCLQQGHYPIVRVRMRGIGNFHYVLITEARDGMFYCMDPLSQESEPVPLSNFGNRIYAVRCVYPDIMSES